VRKTFLQLADAKRWRVEMLGAAQRGRLRAPTRMTLREVAEAWVAEAETGKALTRSSRPFKPSMVRAVALDYRLHIAPRLAGVKVSAIRRADVQHLLDALVAQGLSGSRVRGVLVSLRILLRRPMQDDLLGEDPTQRLRLPPGAGRRDRAASATEAAALLTALPADVRPIYATAFYAGLRRGELRALRWSQVDLASGIIRVEAGWDDVAGEIEPKSAKGKRTVPIVALLRDELVEHKTARDERTGEYVFGSIHGQPFTPSNVRKRAAKAWASANDAETAKAEQEGRQPKLLSPIGLHECRHTFVSLMHDAGLSLERIGDYVGHSSTHMSDYYRHLLDGHEDETRRLVDAYLARANTAGRLEQLDEIGAE
jgi:integrase